MAGLAVFFAPVGTGVDSLDDGFDDGFCSTVGASLVFGSGAKADLTSAALDIFDGGAAGFGAAGRRSLRRTKELRMGPSAFGGLADAISSKFPMIGLEMSARSCRSWS